MKYLRCEKCKKNCCIDCDCKWGLFFFSGRSWWCNKIKKNGECKICDCDYTAHKRDYNYYKHETKIINKEVGLNAEEIKQIDNKISEIRKNIEKEKDLEKNIMARNEQINEYENDIKSKKGEIDKLDKNTNDKKIVENKLLNDISEKEKSKKEIEGIIQQTQDDITKLQNVKDIEEMVKKKEEELKELNDKKKKIDENKQQKKNLETEKVTTNSKISEQQNKIYIAENEKNEKEKKLSQEKVKQEAIKNEVNKLQNEKDILFNNIRDTFKKEKERLEIEKNRIETTIEKTEKETIKQVIKMKVITDEISKIEMKNEKTQSFDKQLKEIYEDNKDFIQNSQKFEPLRKEINSKLLEDENKILNEYGIKKEDLINISPPKKK